MSTLTHFPLNKTITSNIKLPVLIIIRGAPAVGKSTICRTIQQMCQNNNLQCAILGWDIIWDEIFRWPEPKVNKDEELVIDSTSTLLKFAQIICNQGPELLIIEGVFSEKKEADLITSFATKFSKVFYFRVEADFTHQKKRNASRDALAFVSENKILTLNKAFLNSQIPDEILLKNENISLENISNKILNHIISEIKKNEVSINDNITLTQNWITGNKIRYPDDRLIDIESLYFVKDKTKSIFSSLFYFDLPNNIKSFFSNIAHLVSQFEYTFKFKYLNLQDEYESFEDYFKESFLDTAINISSLKVIIEDEWLSPILELLPNLNLNDYFINCSKRFQRTFKKIQQSNFLYYKDNRQYDFNNLWLDVLLIDQNSWKKDQNSDMESLEREDLQYYIPLIEDPFNNRLLVAYDNNTKKPIAYTIMLRSSVNGTWYNAKWGCKDSFRKTHCGIQCLVQHISSLYDEYQEYGNFDKKFIIDFWGRRNPLYEQIANKFKRRAHIILSNQKNV